MPDLTIEDVARLALALPGVTEGTSYGNRAWAVAGKGVAWERPFSKADVKRLVAAAVPVPQGPIVALTTDGLDDKEALLQAHPEYLFTIEHFANYAAVLLHLERASEADLRESLLDAWLVHAPAHLARAYLDGTNSS